MHYIKHTTPSEGYYLGSKNKQIVYSKVPAAVCVNLREDYNYNFYNSEEDLQTAISLIDPDYVYRSVEFPSTPAIAHPSDEDTPSFP